MIVTEQNNEIAVGQNSASLQLGVRAHDFGCAPPDELAERIGRQGFCRAQLALNKAIAGLNLQPGDLNADLGRKIGSAFAQHGVRIEVLGCYINPIHPDLATRKRLVCFFKDHLRCARDFGCKIVALESGSVNADYSPHPANHGETAFREMLASIGELVAEAEKFGVMVGLEAVHSHPVSTAHEMRRVLDIIGSKHLRVVFDAVNLLSPENFREQRRVIATAMDLLADDIAVIHAKDFIFDNGVLKTVPAGRGQLDFAPVMNFIRAPNHEFPVLLEEAGAQESPMCAQFLREKFQESKA